jgi:hypothetical protein
LAFSRLARRLGAKHLNSRVVRPRDHISGQEPPTDWLQPHEFLHSSRKAPRDTVPRWRARSHGCCSTNCGATGPDAPQRNARRCILSGPTPFRQGRTTARVRRRGPQRSSRVVNNCHYIRVALQAAPGFRSGPVAILANLLRPVRGGFKDARSVLRQYRIGRF